MRRFIAATAVLALSLLFLSPALSPAYLHADTLCPDGKNVPLADGTCKLDPFAQACLGNGSSAAACQADGSKNPVSGSDGIILKVVNIFSFVIGAASVIMVLIGGFRYVISSGSGENITKAKDTILYALIGIVVFLLSRGIITFVINKL